MLGCCSCRCDIYQFIQLVAPSFPNKLNPKWVFLPKPAMKLTLLHHAASYSQSTDGPSIKGESGWLLMLNTQESSRLEKWSLRQDPIHGQVCDPPGYRWALRSKNLLWYPREMKAPVKRSSWETGYSGTGSDPKVNMSSQGSMNLFQCSEGKRRNEAMILATMSILPYR